MELDPSLIYTKDHIGNVSIADKKAYADSQFQAESEPHEIYFIP
jgi:hypothetical protein